MSIEIPIDPKVDGGKWYNIKALKTKKVNHLLNVFSNLSEDSWMKFPSTNLPSNFNYGHVFHFIVESIGNFFVDNQNLQEEHGQTDCTDLVTIKPLRKGRMLLNCGFVVDVGDNYDEKSFTYYLRGHVHHSMKSEKPLLVSVAISNKSGYVNYTNCNCRASEIGRCCHVTALLLFLSDYATKNGSIVEKPCTSQPCKWNKGKKRMKNPNALHKVSYLSNKKSSINKLYNWDPRPVNLRKISTEFVSKFVTNLQLASSNIGSQSMWETIIQIPYIDFILTIDDSIYYKQLTKIYL